MATTTVTTSAAEELTVAERAAIIALCEAVFAEPFEQLFALLPGSRHILIADAGTLVCHACWVTRTLQPIGGPSLCTAYIEAVATRPERQGQGYGKQAMARVVAETMEYDLRALSPAVPDFYERLGWEAWRGPTAIRTADGLIDTPEDEIMILRTARTPPLDLDATMVAEWREGELW